MGMANPTRLDANQVLQHAFDDTENRLRVDAEVSATIGNIDVFIDAAGGDNIAIADSTGTNFVNVNGSGQLSVVGPATNAELRATPLPISASSLPLPTDAATESTLASIETRVINIDTKTPALVSGRVPVDGSGVTQPVSVASLPLPIGASTSANQVTGNASLSSIDSKLTTVNTRALVFATDKVDASGSSISVNNFPATQAVTGPLTDAQLRASSVPVSVSSSVLPTGAATSALQTTGNTSLSSIDGKIPANLTVTSTRLLVDGSGVTQPVSAASLPLPTGAATSANQVTTNSSLASIDNKLNSLGQKTMAGSVPVVIASDQSFMKTEDAVSANADIGVPMMAIRTATPIDKSDSEGDYEMLQMKNGRLWTSTIQFKKRTYSASINGLNIASSATDFFTITGAANTTVEITSISFIGTGVTTSIYDLLLIKRSTANSGGTSTTLTAVSHSSSDAAANATNRAYTANPTLGTIVGQMRASKVLISGASGATSQLIIWNFGQNESKPITLLSSSEVLALNFNSQTANNNSLDIYIEWTEY